MAARGLWCGIFGGTFDPIHMGHIRPVMAAARAAGLTKVIYIPAGRPPHRPPPAARAGDRLAMVKIALADAAAARSKESAAVATDVALEADDLELQRRGASYTIDTVQELQRRAPRTNYVLLLGLDALLNFETWHRWDALQRGVHIVGIARPGWRAPEPLPAWWRTARVESAAALRDASAGKILIIETAPVDISATAVRDNIRARRAAAGVPPGVLDYIRQHNLYADPTPA